MTDSIWSHCIVQRTVTFTHASLTLESAFVGEDGGMINFKPVLSWEGSRCDVDGRSVIIKSGWIGFNWLEFTPYKPSIIENK